MSNTKPKYLVVGDGGSFNFSGETEMTLHCLYRTANAIAKNYRRGVIYKISAVAEIETVTKTRRIGRGRTQDSE